MKNKYRITVGYRYHWRSYFVETPFAWWCPFWITLSEHATQQEAEQAVQDYMQPIVKVF